LKVQDGCLHQFIQVQGVDRRIVAAPSIALSQVLEDKEITTKGKILLAYILAKSVWRYYDSDFMRIKWTTESIHFMREHRLDPQTDTDLEKIDPSNPFFAFQDLGQDEPTPIEQYKTGNVLHQFPRVLALGIMLAEIGRKTPTTTAHGIKSSDAQINSDLTRYKEVLRSSSWPCLDVRNEEIRARFRDAVGTCLDPKVFHNAPSSEKQLSGVSKRRDTLYRRVVFPLERLCAELGIIDQPDVVQLLNYAATTASTGKIPCGMMLSGDEHRRYVPYVFLDVKN
jgi:hypothetical protein